MSASPTRRELAVLTRLATPIVITQLASMAMGAVDVLMLGWYSREALAAASLGRIWVMGTQLVAQGVLFGLDPIVAQAHGARDARAIGLTLQRGLLLAALISVPLLLSWLLTAEVLIAAGIEPRLAHDGEVYALGRLPGALFFLWFMALRSWLQGRRVLRPALYVVLAANVMNWFANLVLINGAGPIPELGVLGAGLATSVTQIAQLAGLLWLVSRFRLARGGWQGWSREVWKRVEFTRVLRIGLPTGLQLGLEVWAFQIAHLMSGRLGEREAAAHAIVMTISSIAFMVPLGLGIGAQTRVGNSIGEGRHERASLAARVALRVGSGVMLLFAAAMILGDRELPALFTDDPGVVAFAAIALPIAGLFQLFDGVQVIASCILRGAGRTMLPAGLNLVAYYGVGLPLSAYLGFYGGWGFAGIWVGLAAGLAVAAFSLVIYLARVFDGGDGESLRV